MWGKTSSTLDFNAQCFLGNEDNLHWSYCCAYCYPHDGYYPNTWHVASLLDKTASFQTSQPFARHRWKHPKYRESPCRRSCSISDHQQSTKNYSLPTSWWPGQSTSLVPHCSGSKCGLKRFVKFLVWMAELFVPSLLDRKINIFLNISSQQDQPPTQFILSIIPAKPLCQLLDLCKGPTIQVTTRPWYGIWYPKSSG